jgi:hypothetical protein
VSLKQSTKKPGKCSSWKRNWKEKHIKDANEEIGEKSKTTWNCKKSSFPTKEANLREKEKWTWKNYKRNRKRGKHFKDIESARAHVEERLLVGYDRIRNNYRKWFYSSCQAEWDKVVAVVSMLYPIKQSGSNYVKKLWFAKTTVVEFPVFAEWWHWSKIKSTNIGIILK